MFVIIFDLVFSIWDRLFNRYRHNADPAKIQIGLPACPDTRMVGLMGLLRKPLQTPGHIGPPR